MKNDSTTVTVMNIQLQETDVMANQEFESFLEIVNQYNLKTVRGIMFWDSISAIKLSVPSKLITASK